MWPHYISTSGSTQALDGGGGGAADSVVPPRSNGLPARLQEEWLKLDKKMYPKEMTSAAVDVPRRVGFIGSSDFKYFGNGKPNQAAIQESANEDAIALGKMLAAKGVALVTGGEGGWEPMERVAEGHALQGHAAPSFHLVPNNGEVKTEISDGATLYAGATYHERRALLGAMCPVYIVFGGGPGTINEVLHALAQGAIVIPFCRTGGAAGGQFGFPHCPLPSRSQGDRDAYAALKSATWDGDRGKQIALIEGLIDSAFKTMDKRKNSIARTELSR